MIWRRIISGGAAAGLLLGSVTAGEPVYVAGFNRLADSGQLEMAGELLLGELGCVNCHEPGENLRDRFTVYHGPDLRGVGNRLNAAFIARFVSDPPAAHPGTRMPNLFAGLSAAEKQSRVQQVVKALLSLAGDAPEQTERGKGAKSIEAGRRLFHTVGCAACHEPEPGYNPAGSEASNYAPQAVEDSVSLDHVAEKYKPGALARFIQDPLAVRPSARMPAIPISPQEARDLEAYLTRHRSERAAPETGFPEGQSDLRVLAEFGCASCHETGMRFEEETLLRAAALEKLDPRSGRGCLGEDSGILRYSLSELQCKALIAALERLRTAKRFSANERLGRTLHALNCYACHGRGGVAGPDPARQLFFTSNADDLGDEGRFPPPLDRPGAKFRPEALYKILLGEGAVRPYMNTRMPGFGAEHAAALTALFVETAPAFTNHPPVVGRNALGRELVGNQGLNCITCHSLHGHRSLGIPALDLATVPGRLRPEWFREHLVDPAGSRPGTRMPSFWPDGKGVHPALGRDPYRQIDSIWVYLNESDQTRLPSGMENPADFVLVPKERPIVFRTFMEGAGMHAIAVGFPEELHAAFDSREVRWALLWKGAFLDAEATWDDRFAPLTKPLGTPVIQMPKGPGVAILSSPDQPWPANPEFLKFEGYRLNRDGCPSFLYRIGGIAVTDILAPMEGGKFQRRIELRSDAAAGTDIWLRAAAGERIEKAGEGYVVDGRWRTSVRGAALIVRSAGAGKELLARIQFQDNQAEMIQEFAW